MQNSKNNLEYYRHRVGHILARVEGDKDVHLLHLWSNKGISYHYGLEGQLQQGSGGYVMIKTIRLLEDWSRIQPQEWNEALQKCQSKVMKSIEVLHHGPMPAHQGSLNI